MPAFNLEHEYNRIAEMNTSREEKIESVEDSLRTYLMERTAAPSTFGLEVAGEDVLARGYEHRGDVLNSYEKSVEEADTERIARRYELENLGYEKAKELFFTYPVYSTVMMMSPTPDNPIPGYPGHHMAYFYHILPHESGDESKRTIKALTWVNDLTKKEQAGLLSELGDTDVIPTEEAILTHPVGVSTGTEDAQSFQKLWESIGSVVQQKVREYSYQSTEQMERFLLHGKDIWENELGELAEMVKVFSAKIVDSESQAEFMKTSEWKIMVNLADKLLFRDVSSRLRTPQSPVDATDGSIPIFMAYEHLDFTPRTAFTSCGIDDFGGGFDQVGSVITATYDVAAGMPIMRPEDDPNLCRCGGDRPHFHCPGTKFEIKQDKDGKETKNKVACRHKIIVGKGITKCPECGEGKKC